nr:putative reverse transcriptase, RNA-dependent DNA polymerase [Tanacetum cinerariifolium]
MDEEVDEQELEAHYSYMAKIQEVPIADTGTDSEPVEQVQNEAGYNVFANDLQHSEQSESVKRDDESVALANLIANLKLDVDENKKIQKQLKKANTTFAQELKECKAILAETTATIGNEIQNHSTTSTEAPNISATPEHSVLDMISEVSSSQTNNLDKPQPDNLDNPHPDNLDENNADDIQDSTFEILQEHEEGAKYPMANIAERNLSNNAKAFAVWLCSEEIPSSFKQALKSKKWKKAMDDEMKALEKNKTWDQCALPHKEKLFMEKKAKLADRNRYQRSVGKLIYLSHTRPDIAHAVGV